MREIFVRSAYNYDMDAASDESALSCDHEEDRTQQHFAEECDINTIVKRFGLTGELPEVVRVPVSGDFTDVVDFQTAMEAVRRAQEGFMELPGELRYRFGNDPQKLMEFMEDGRNLEEARKLGLVNKPPEVTRDQVASEEKKE